ncbi:Centromere protein K, partial [Apaloderma vittatum]
PEAVNDSDAKEELMAECESIWNQMEECQNKLTLLQTHTLLKSDAKLSLLMMQVKAFTAEYNEWQKRSPEIISANPDVLLTVGREELQKVKKELEMVLSALRVKNKQLDEDLNREQQWYEEQEQIAAALERIEEREKTQTEELSKNSIFNELHNEASKLKTFKEELLNALGKFLEDHFPLPEKSGRAKKCFFSFPMSNPFGLQILIKKTLKTPHEPYVTISDSFWPPYIELLLRYGIVLRHPEDPNRIRLEAFH